MMDNFKYKVELHLNYVHERSSACMLWCEEHAVDWQWKWHDAGQHGWHEFFFSTEADLLVFKLANGI